MELYSIDTGFFKLDGGAFFGVVPKALWQKLNPPDENNLCNWAMRCLLAVDGPKRILVDTGIGDKQDPKVMGYYHLNGSATLEGSLAALGFSPSDITDVVLTHLHLDHCGGAIRRRRDPAGGLEPAFPNADYWTSSRQWDWAVNPNRREAPSFLKENILPMRESGRLRFIDESTALHPDFRVRLYDGHTEGQAIPFIKHKGRTVVFLGDFIPSAAHLPVHYVPGYDIRPLQTMAEKERFLDEAAGNGYVLFFEHDPRSECCTVTRTPKGVRAAEVFPLKELKQIP